MANIRITADTKNLNRKMSNLIARQLPFAVSHALNQTAKTMLTKNKQDMKLAFRNPVPYTLNAYYFKWARKGDTSVTIERKVKPAGRHYLEVQESGGPRPRKAFETKYMHRLKTDLYVNNITPTRHAPTLKSGHLSMGFMEKVTHQLNASNTKPMTVREIFKPEPKTKRKSRAKKYFIPASTHPLGQGIRAGIYERTSAGNVKKVLNFTTVVPRYKKRTNFYVKMNRYAAHILPARLRSSMAHAIRTARF